MTFEVKQPSTTLNKALPENASIIQQCSSVSQLASSSPVKGHTNEQVKKAEQGKDVYHGSLLVEENKKVSDEKHGSAAVFFSRH